MPFDRYRKPNRRTDRTKGIPMMIPGTEQGDAAILDMTIQAFYHLYGPLAGDEQCYPGEFKGVGRPCLPSRHSPIEN